MKSSIHPMCHALAQRYYLYIIAILLINFMPQWLSAQCVPTKGTIEGLVFGDVNNNGIRNATETGIPGVLVQAYDATGALVGSSTTNSSGTYSFSNLSDGQMIRLSFLFLADHSPSFMGSNNGSSVQFVQVPACSIGLGLVSDGDFCNSGSEILTTCFVQGNTTLRPNEPTIVGIPYGFNSATPARKFAMHGETGAIWGLAWKNSTKEIFSSSFVKQYAGLKNGHDAIFKTSFNGSMYTTQLFTKLSSLGLPVGVLAESDVNNCAYGDQVGKIGLGALVISPDEKYLYVINIYNHSLVRISASNPTAGTTKSYKIPGTGAYAFALKYYNDKIYVGATIPGDNAFVYIFDPVSEIFTDAGLKIGVGAQWDVPYVLGGTPAHWLTDIDFTDNGDMLISLSDRIGHIYCNSLTNRLDEQKGDLMIAWKKGSGWELEDRTEGKEFFSDDYWVTNPVYHSEITIGSIFAMPGTGSVVATVFDPEINSYSGGLHRYNTTSGKKEGSKELYTRETVTLFGKATGFGEVIAACGLPEIEIGNLVWNDVNDNGLQDADESGLADVTLNIYDENCVLAGSTATNSKGNYVFNNSNVTGGLFADRTYYIGIHNQHYDAQNESYNIGNSHYKLTKNESSFPMIDSDAKKSGLPCDGGLFAVNVKKTNHNFDIGLTSPGICRVKIKTTVITSKTVKISDNVMFEITVSNNGGTALTDIDITDKLPAGYKFEAVLNPAWTNENGILKTRIKDKLLPGSKISVLLNLGFDATVKGINFANEAVISSAKDAYGNPIIDLNSCLELPEDARDSGIPAVCDLALLHVVEKEGIYTPQSQVVLVTTICNQGTIDAESFSIVNYLNPELDFDPLLNPGWSISDDLKSLFYSESKTLGVNTCRNFLVKLSIKKGVEVSQIINYAEISTGACSGSPVDFDFDSTPDTDVTNDKGGQPKTATDNMIDDHGIIDEDDHDPAVIRLDKIDLSLNKTVASRRFNPGDLVVFNIKVNNEGNVPVSQVKIVDYLSEHFILEDPNWTLEDGKAYRVLQIPGNLQPGASVITSISCRINPIAKHPLLITNTAEIENFYNQFNEDISFLDIDSTPDADIDNDNQNDEKEDDISTVSVYLICPVEVEACSACRAATTPSNGQFELFLKIAAGEDEGWFVESSIGLYDLTSPVPPGAPVPLANGYLLSVMPNATPEHSFYILRAIHLDNQGFSVRFRNKYGDIEQYTAQTSACSFARINVDGARSLCIGGKAKYTASSSLTNTSFIWIVDGDTLSGQNGPVLNFDWAGYNSGSHTLQVSASPGCIAPSVINVALGEADKSAIACIGSFNVSLDGNCSMTITPSMMVAGSLNPNSPYSVMLIDAHGNPIADATLSSVHAGTKVTAKLIEGCGGNTCWSTITVEDKTPPVSICSNISLPCYKLGQYVGPFERDNCGGPVKNILVSEKITPLTCSENFVKYIDRVYQATDKFGNKSALCNMRISVERPDFNLIKFPPSFLMIKDSALVCDKFLKDDEGHPSVTTTGVPTIAGLPLYPSFPEVCNLYTGYKDKDFGFINCTRKIIRTWTVYEQWCSDGRVLTFNQVLEITDTIPPVIKPLPNVTVSTNGSAVCEGDFILPLADVTDVCSDIIEVDVQYPGGFAKNIKVPTRIKLPAGLHAITYTAYDACHNSSQISYTVTVQDITAPTVICKGLIALGLNSNGEGYLFPRNIDDGSFDGCGIDRMKVARMVPNGLIPDTSFKDFIGFKCADVGRQIMVALRVWDVNGNSNSCMVNVEVQDKHVPKISCPADITIDCSDVFTGMNLTQYGIATAIDACGATVTELAPKFVLNSCRVGYIERTFIASDGQNTATCKQIITVENSDYFDPLTHVIRPLDYEVVDKCSADELRPENLPAAYGYPVITQSACGMAAATYKDEVYTFVTGACYKILRRWTVIDWCEMERLGGDYYPYNFSQVIKVTNTVPPFFTGNLPARDTFFTAKGNCIDALVHLQATASDLCTPDAKLKWYYKIDWNNDGTYDIVNSGLGNLATINTVFPVGLHRVQWTFEDQCGNLTTKDQLILVKNNDKPVPSGLESISVSINPMDTNGDGIPDIEMACIKAWTLNASSYSQCCPGPLRFSFTGNLKDSIICFDCFDVGRENIVQLWVHDCNGNKDFVNVKVDVQDNNTSDVCEQYCINNGPKPTIIGNNIICTGGSATLTATGGNIYHWNTGATTASITVSPSSATTYTVTVTNESRCTASASIIVTLLPLPNVNIAGNNVCLGSSTVVSATGGGTYLWNTGATSSSITVSPVVNTTYTVTVTGTNGCTAAASRLITVYPRPTVNITGQNIICVNQSTTLTATGGVTYLWNNGATTSAITVTPLSATTYTVTATDANGCTNTANRTVTVNGLSINITIAGNNIICRNQSTTLTASGGISYIWSTSATTAAINVSPISTTSYTVTATDANGCTGTATRTVTVNDLPNPLINGGNICIGSNTTLQATGGVSYVWNNGATASFIVVSPPATTTYTVTVTAQNGCTASTSRQVVVFPRPTIAITGETNICLNQSTTLTASGANTYLWNTGAITPAITVTPLTTTTYTVTGTDSNGCTGTASLTVTVNGSSINIVITGDNDLCVGESTTLTATGGVAYVWSNGQSTSSITVAPVVSTTYTVTATDVNGCNGTSSILVTVHPLPPVIIAGNSSICIGSSTTLIASGASTYIWNTGETGASITVSPIATSTYTVTGTDSNSCSNTATVTVTVNPPANAFITGDDIICVGESTTLSATGGNIFLWSNGAITSSITVSPITTTTYTVTVTNANGCTGTASRTVTVNLNPVPVISGNTLICLGETTTLTATGGTSYLWNTGAVTSSISVSPTVNTTYTVTVTDANGCTGSTSATVLVDPGDLVCATQNITVFLGPTGAVAITPADISTGTSGVCSSIISTVVPNMFFCNDVGVQVVTLTVTNTNNNQSLSCTALVTVEDVTPPILVCPANLTLNCNTFNPNLPLSAYGNATVSDNCPLGLNLTQLPIINLNACNVGQITRTFTATDNSGNSVQCVQLIDIVNPNPFMAANITFPPDVTISNCAPTAPSSTGAATVNQGSFTCANISITFTDNIPPAPLCAGNFQRIWTVTDACQLEPGTNNGIYVHTQNIIVNVQVPQIVGSRDTIFITRDSVTCMAGLNGVFHSATGCNLILSNNINSNPNFNVSGEYPNGPTNVRLIARETCNNLADTLDFVVFVRFRDLQIACRKTYPVMTDALTVHENVYDHASIIQNCQSGLVVASYSNSFIYDTTRDYTCANLPGPFAVTIYFWYEGQNAPFTLCNSLVGLTDPNHFCLSPPTRVSGSVKTENNQPVPHVSIDLDGSNGTPVNTGMNGLYAFPEMPSGGTYSVIPFRNDHPLDGVSTLDLIFIQRHILKTEELKSPYKIIAADINRDNKVTAGDILQLRKLILGIYDEFPDNTSWRMIDKSFVFTNPADPFRTPLDEQYYIDHLVSDMNIDWVGVKTGDVNGSYVTNVQNNETSARSSALQFIINNENVATGHNTLPVYASSDIELSGFQISVAVKNAAKVRLSGSLLNLQDFNYIYVNGVLTVSWHDAKGVSLKSGDHLFDIHLTSGHAQAASELFEVVTSRLNAEYYTTANEIGLLSLRFAEKESDSFEVLGNVPNPWDNTTAINFSLPASGEVSLKIRDITGRIVYTTKSYFAKGANTFTITRDQLSVSGILLYDLTFGNQVKTLKMINIK